MSSDGFRCAYLVGPRRIELREVPTRHPDGGELLLGIDAATTCGTDVKVYRRGGHPRMLTAPCPFGHEMAGTVLERGAEVADWIPGDRVVVANSAPCGNCAPCRAGRENLCEDLHYLNGSFAEQLIVPARFGARSVYRLPDSVAAAVGALAEPLACVLHGIDRMRLQPQCDAVILGGGPIGLMFVSLLADQGHRVTLADPHADRLEHAGALGAQSTHRIADRDTFSEELRQRALSPSGFDAAIDATGTPGGWRAAMDSVRPGGTVNFFGGCSPGTEVPLDTHCVHYGELTLLGCYHHLPSTFGRAVELLSRSPHPLARLLSFDCPLDDVEAALVAMIERRAIKVAVRPRGVPPSG